jgi:hypothetical protein
MLRRAFLAATGLLGAAITACTSGGGAFFVDGGTEAGPQEDTYGTYGTYGQNGRMWMHRPDEPVYGGEPRYGSAADTDPRHASATFERLTNRPRG